VKPFALRLLALSLASAVCHERKEEQDRRRKDGRGTVSNLPEKKGGPWEKRKPLVEVTGDSQSRPAGDYLFTERSLSS